ncbi:MAG: ABC transporter ATP-binding protein, partial [Kurthia sp.]
PQILLLDEPTKGLDLFAKENYRQLLNELKNNGMSILIVTHDLEFAARTSDGCTLFFDHKLVAIKSPQQFYYHVYKTRWEFN